MSIVKRLVKRFARELCGVDSDSFESAYYGKVPYPWYDRAEQLRGDIPGIYNSAGEKMDIFFIRDRHFAFDPYDVDFAPSHWLWDRYNFGLKTHFYTHFEMLRCIGSPDKRYAALLESESICPEDYRIFDVHKGLEQDFDLIFTYSERLLDRLDNARFFPFFANSRYGCSWGGGSWDETAYAHKCRQISIVSSNKEMCHLHAYRIDLARTCRREGLADTFGTFDGGPYVKIAETLRDYRYSIVVENDIKPFFFTNKVTDCFAAMAVPIYCGATEIGKFFNLDGIIVLKPGDDIRRVLAQCSEKDYLERLPAIKDNYLRAYAYRNVWDWLESRYLTKEVK